MEPDTYFLSAITGILLAGFVIAGWKRLFPVLFIGLMLHQVAPAQYGDYDDDVPAINEVRDQVLAQMTMLDNYLNGYTSPNKLNDISNSLEEINGKTTAMRNNLINISGNTSATGSINYNLEDISNNLEAGGYSAAQWLSFLKNNNQTQLYEIKQINEAIRNYSFNIQTYTDNIRNNTSNTIDAVNNVKDSLSNAYGNNVFWTTYGSQVALENLVARSFDSDDDVPHLETIITALGYLDSDNDVDAINAVSTAVLDAKVDMNFNHSQILPLLNTLVTNTTTTASASPPAPGTIPDTPDPPAPGPFQDFNQANQPMENDSTLSGFSTLYSGQSGLQTKLTPNLTPISVSSTPKPLGLPTINLPYMTGSVFSNFDTDLDTKFADSLIEISPVVKPILTGVLCFGMFMFMLKSSTRMLAS